MQEIINNFLFVLYVVGCLWVIFLVDFIFQLKFAQYGIRPRKLKGLVGIIFAPLIHSSLRHLTANSSVLMPLLFIAIYFDIKASFSAIALIILVTGLGTWIFGTPRTVHIGASGVIFGLFGFLLFVGFYQQNIQAIIVSIIVFAIYGSLLFSLVIIKPKVSFTGHIFGFLGGILAAIFT